MPNGGADNCMNCGFNSANEGRWHDHAEDLSESSCIIRDGIPITHPAWTYCENHVSGSTEAIGPIYASGLDVNEGRFVIRHTRIPWHGATEPQVNVPAVCVICGLATEHGITIAADRRTIVGACSNDHYAQWRMTVHPDEPLLPLVGEDPWGEYEPAAARGPEEPAP